MGRNHAAAALTMALGLLAAAQAPAGAQTRAPVAVKPLFSTMAADLAGKRMTVVEVEFAPGATSEAHRHPGSVFAYVLSGAVRSQLGGEGAPRVFKAGESWYEPPGARHLVAANGSDTDPARLLAVMIGDDGAALVMPDAP